MTKAARKVVEPVSPPLPPPNPSQEEVDEVIAKLALQKIEPRFQELVRILLRTERTVEDWERVVRNLSSNLGDASLPEVDAALQLFVHAVEQQRQSYGTWLERAEQELQNMSDRPPAYRSSIGEVWRRTHHAVKKMMEHSRQALRLIGAEKAERLSTNFARVNPASYTSEQIQDLAAATLYKSFADIIYETNCEVIEEGEDASRSFIVSVPVPADMERPHRVFADREERVHESVEEFFPDLLGRTYIRYTST